jgi:hypothetical protein
MKAVLKLPYADQMGNLIWMPPYLYPADDLKNGLELLRQKGYWVTLFPEDDGIAFSSHVVATTEMFDDLRIAFVWIDIKLYADNEEFDYEKDISKYQLIILPVSRLEIDEAILTDSMCLFPAGAFQIEKIDVRKLSGSSFQGGTSNPLRDYVTDVTNVEIEVFKTLPVIVFTKEISFEFYHSLKQNEDNDLIKSFSQTADDMLDLLRFYRGEYNIPELMPAKAGIWNNRYSTALVYFPKYQVGYIQAREVELKTFIKGIGMDFFQKDLIEMNPLLNFEISEVGFVAKHALKLNTVIHEMDDLTMKFAQIMILFEYLGNPNEFENFKKIKPKLVACIAKDKAHYHILSERFRELTGGIGDNAESKKIGIRTSIIHLGKRIEDLMGQEDRKALFRELQHYVTTLINDLILNADMKWDEYDAFREQRKNSLIK